MGEWTALGTLLSGRRGEAGDGAEALCQHPGGFGASPGLILGLSGFCVTLTRPPATVASLRVVCTFGPGAVLRATSVWQVGAGVPVVFSRVSLFFRWAVC